MKYKIFYAWQSQNKEIQGFIKKQLKMAKEKIEREDEICITIIMTPTQEDSGSPDINEAIWRQIRDSDVFLADLSFATESSTSNDNVMYETGIADALLGEHRIILLCDENTKKEKIAFDINHKRITSFKTTDAELYKRLANWIRVALRAADNERFAKRHVINEISEDLVIILNYFFRLSMYSDVFYSRGLNVLSSEDIGAELRNTRIGMYMAKVDFSPVIESLTNKLQLYMSFINEKTIWHIMRVIAALKGYQFYCRSIQYRHLVISAQIKEEYGLYDLNTFFLKEGENPESITGSAFFTGNSIICQNENCNIVLDKRIVTVDNENFRVQKVVIGGCEYNGVKMNTATFADGYVRYLAEYINRILDSAVGLVEDCGFEMEHIAANGNESGIVSLKLK